MPRLLDSFLDLLETPMSLRELFRGPRRLAVILVLGVLAEGIGEYQRHLRAVRQQPGATGSGFTVLV